jgi:alginate O-acetyltransferase complex protein AlgI
MSYQALIFIFVFLPVVGICHRLALRFARPTAKPLLLVASLLFYALGDLSYLPVLAGSVVFNFLVGKHLMHIGQRTKSRAWALGGAISANLLLLAAHKYGLISVERSGGLGGVTALAYAGAIPLGMSFYTLQQITYLVDASRSTKCRSDFSSYALYVTFFAQIVAGPIVRFTRNRAQFTELVGRVVSRKQLHRGLSLFIFGLAKKVVLADSLGRIVNPVFSQVADGGTPSVLAAWLAAYGFLLQIYFDFSAYSDMAVGIGLIFGILLPINFNSPLRAVSPTDFFGRWHITLSAFIRDFVFLPTFNLVRQLTPGKKVRRMVIAWSVATPISLMAVGLWHGASGTFVLWGFLAGLNAVFFQLITIRRQIRQPSNRRFHVPRWVGRVATLFTLPIITLFFRVEHVSEAGVILSSMFDWSLSAGSSFTTLIPGAADNFEIMNGFKRIAESPAYAIIGIGVAFAITLWAPNTNSIFQLTHDDAVEVAPTRLRWCESLKWAIFTGCILMIAIVFIGYRSPLPVIYGQF